MVENIACGREQHEWISVRLDLYEGESMVVFVSFAKVIHSVLN